MQLALAQAQQGLALGEVPVGAVLVKDGQLIAAAHNTPVQSHDPSAHAEINALRQAGQKLGNYRLEGCTLYVTLEPCAMCAGAILNARIDKVVWGASEPKSGASGSVLEVLGHPRLNHHTQVQAGFMAEACAKPLQTFFTQQRALMKQQASHQRLRDDAVRTPDSAFEGLPGYPWQAHYLSDLPALNGLRMHYLDEGPADATVVWLCLHGNPAWSYLYRRMIPEFLKAGHRVVAPDMPGFGKSDKPKRDDAHTFLWHRQVLLEFIESLDLQHVHMVVQDWGGILGLTLPMAMPSRFEGLLIMNTTLATGMQALSDGFVAWRKMCADKPLFDIGKLFSRGNPHLSEAECQAYNAPFPDGGHRAATRAFPPMVPSEPNSPGADISRQAQAFWSQQWQGRSLMFIGQQDPVLGEPVMRPLQALIQGCPEPICLPHAGHFVQEHGQTIAQDALKRWFS